MLDPHPALRPRPAELCQLAGVWRGDVEPGGTWAEPKIDGVRCVWRRGEMVTREGMPIPGAGHIARSLAELEAIAGMPMVFDGEFVAGDDYRATLAHVSSKAPDDAGTLHLFDALPLDAWECDDNETPLNERKAALGRLYDAWRTAADAQRAAWDWEGHTRALSGDWPPISIVPDEWLGDAAAVQARAAEIWSAGGEGLMLKDWSAPYRRKRSDAWRKVKREGWATRALAPIR